MRKLLTPMFDWDRLVAVAARHALLVLVYRRLAACCPELIPGPIRAEMHAYACTNVANNLLMVKELRELLELLDAEGIAAVPYKGLALAHIAYRDPDEREISDIDIFVHRRDLKTIRRILPRQGYELHTRADSSVAFERTSYHYSFVRTRSQRLIEIHWRFVRDPLLLAPNAHWPWDSLVPLAFDGIKTHTFTAEDWLILLCAHGAKHTWKHLSNIYDLASLTRHQPIEWALVEAQARLRGVWRMTALGLLLAADLMQAPVPSDMILRARADRNVATQAAAITASIWRDEVREDRFHGVTSVVYGWQLRERLLDKLAWIYQALFWSEPNAADRALVSLPARLHLLYRALRLGRLVVVYGWGFVRRGLKQMGSGGDEGHTKSMR